MNKLRMSDFGDASGIHEKIFHITEQCTYSQKDENSTILSVFAGTDVYMFLDFILY